MKVVIKNMEKKPEHCAECPICNADDDCWILSKWYETWEDQYKDCPLQEVSQPNPFNAVVQLLEYFDLHTEWSGDINELAQYICDLFKDGPYDPGEKILEVE